METVNSFARDTMQRVQHRFGGIRDKRNTEGGIRDENISRDPDALISIGGMRDSFKIVGGILDENASDLLKMEHGGIGIKILKVVGWRDEAKTSVGMRDLKSLFWTLHACKRLKFPNFFINSIFVILKDIWLSKLAILKL